MRKKSILRKLRFYMISFGILMGFVFPVYANFFVKWKEGAFVYFFLGCIVAGITVGLVSYTFVKTILLRQLFKISVQASALKNKDLSKVINIESDDSIGLIVSGLNAAVYSIRDLFVEVQKIYELADISLSKVENINFVEGVKVASIGEINKNIQNVSVVSSSILNLSEQIINTISDGKKKVDSSVLKLEETATHINKFTEIIVSLVEKSEKISEITGIIEDISAKTNILSLNASIEAARAGKQGRSFAVVADEIRKLATSTNDSAQKISSYISLIQHDVSAVNNSIEVITTGVKGNSEDVKQLLGSFNQINGSSMENLDESGKLAVAVENLNISFSDIQLIFEELSGNINYLKKIINVYSY